MRLRNAFFIFGVLVPLLTVTAIGACAKPLSATDLWNRQTAPVSSMVFASTRVDVTGGASQEESTEEELDLENSKQHVKRYDKTGNLTYDMIMADGFQFERTGPDSWSRRELPLTLAPMTQPLSPGPRETLVTIQEVGTETIDGHKVRHLTLDRDMEAMARRLWPDYDSATPDQKAGWEEPRQHMLASQEKAHVWIDESGLVWKIRLVSSAPTVGNIAARSGDMTITIKAYNTPLSITAPPGAA